MVEEKLAKLSTLFCYLSKANAQLLLPPQRPTDAGTHPPQYNQQLTKNSQDRTSQGNVSMSKSHHEAKQSDTRKAVCLEEGG